MPMLSTLLLRRRARPPTHIRAVAGVVLAVLTLSAWAGQVNAQEQAPAAGPWMTAGTVKRLGVSLHPAAHDQTLTPRVKDIDVARWRDPHGDATTVPNTALNAAPNIAPTAGRFGAPWQAAHSSLGLEHQAVALQLESGARLSLRARAGGAVLVLRNRF